MVKKLRKKFVITAMLSLLVIILVMITVLNAANLISSIRDTDNLLTMLAENGGDFPKMGGMQKAPFDNTGKERPDSGKPALFMPLQTLNNNRSREMPFMARYFFVRTDSTGALVTDTNVTRIASVSEEEAESMSLQVLEKGKKSGFLNSYRYLVSVQEDSSLLIVFMDVSTDLYRAYTLLLSSLAIGLIALIAMFVLVYLFSGRAVAPVVESLEKQKRFITDAGHELKTPLAVISANVDVLELESGKSEWTQSIRNQIKRLNSLVKNLLTLSRMSEESLQVVFSDFNISAVVSEAAASFEAMAESKKISYETDITQGIICHGDRAAINQLCCLLLDNAIKYCAAEGHVNVVLYEKKTIHLEVSNTCDDIPAGNLDRLFDRFYRSDLSRSRDSGGYGIGLSVARAIVTSHKGSITAKKDSDRIIRFIADLPKVN